jgi:RNA polymerase subunit RPABC4/transcription elongation factor Spt4
MAECVHQCLDCKTTFPRKDSICPNCGSQNFQDLLTVNSQLTIHSGIKVTIGDKKKRG